MLDLQRVVALRRRRGDLLRHAVLRVIPAIALAFIHRVVGAAAHEKRQRIAIAKSYLVIAILPLARGHRSAVIDHLHARQIVQVIVQSARADQRLHPSGSVRHGLRAMRITDLNAAGVRTRLVRGQANGQHLARMTA